MSEKVSSDSLNWIFDGRLRYKLWDEILFTFKYETEFDEQLAFSIFVRYPCQQYLPTNWNNVNYVVSLVRLTCISCNQIKL